MSTPATGGGMRLRAYRNPLRLAASAGLWAGAGYLLAYQVVGWVLFAIAFIAVGGSAIFAVTIAGLPLLVGAAAAIRGCANVERGRLRAVFAEPVRGRYRRVERPGVVAQVRTRWKDPATWRDVAYLLGMFVPLAILDLVVLVVWLVLLAGVALPIWYWAPWQTFAGGVVVHGVQLGYFPNGPNGHGATGFYVDTLPKALLAAAVLGVAWLLFNYVLLATARAHALVARALLRAPQDPLAAAKQMLSEPSPLAPLLPEPVGSPPGPAPTPPGPC